MKKLVNTTATADVGYIEKLPYRRPTPETAALVFACVTAIIEALKVDAEADIQHERNAIDELIFDLFEIRGSRDEIRRFYRTVGRVEAQAASE